ncbi:putative carboxypeptidase C [Lupinus albus]|uniref:Carboxypeptidase n=1 Tax=Lupinus albus TaxID=3870 RepID=A0A6A4N1F5_LUPAL|nr:putative carboxypeptidase C [Lupinus albus]
MAFLSLIKISLSNSLFFFILPSFSSSRPTFPTPKPLLQSYSPKSQAESLIRSFNLSPKYPVNIIASDTAFVPGSIVENKVPFLGASGPSVEELGHHAGYYSLLHSKAARMFYFFFESRNRKDDPVVIWLTGGPGCSSSLALFYENGPFSIANNMSLLLNRYGWDKCFFQIKKLLYMHVFLVHTHYTKVTSQLGVTSTFCVSNILFVDQPTGTGFSYSSYEEDIRHDELGVSNDLYDFLQAFFKKHPEFVKNDFYITGESYAGHYIPALASRVHKGNIKKQGIHINLKFYDIRKQCEGNLCYDFSNLDNFLNNDKVKDALGVKDLDFVSCSSTVYYAMLEDWMKNLEVDIPSLLEDGIKLLVYAGEEDLICNWLGNYRWVRAMKWSGQKKFKSAPKVKFIVDGVEAGSLTSHGPLSFLKVYQAGHMVPMDQPKASLEMLRKWMGGKLSVSKKRD